MIFQAIDEIMWLVILYVIFLLIMAIFLKIALGFFSKAKHTNFGQVFLTAFLITVAYAVIFYFLGGWLAWIVALLLAWLIIMVSHNIGFLAAIVVTILAFLIYVLVAIVLGMIIGTTLVHIF
jgi:hypothetical protein